MRHRSSAIEEERMGRFLSGSELYGNDFDSQELHRWYAEEEEGYADLGAKERSHYRYEYHALNRLHGFRHLPKNKRFRILGLGSAYGDELTPILGQAQSVTILDPSSAFQHDQIEGVPLKYVKPQVSGTIEEPDDSFDLITSFGVLHHIANVGFVLTELHRVLASGGYMLLREPIVSMGDWRQPRAGLTMNERGIPLAILRELATSAGFSIIKETLCDFPLTRPVFGPFGTDVFNSKAATIADVAMSRLFAWNLRYHSVKKWQKLRPASCAMVLKKRI
jgi:2-polyprenyl-3-methyl-5-hydroxy-6-metoxy-1,4-benzoquinol methylase